MVDFATFLNTVKNFNVDQDAIIAQGATADLFAWPNDDVADAVVLKLYHAGYPLMAAQQEAANARVAHAAGLPTPAVLDVGQIGERAGVLFERIHGPTMLEQMLAGPSDALPLAHTLAELHVALHQISAAHSAAPPQQTRLENALTRAKLSQTVRTEMQQILQQLSRSGPTGLVLCHGDFHPSNIIISPAGPVIIDWVDLTQGDPTADVARTLLLLEYAVLPFNMPPEMVAQITALRRQFAAAYVARYTELDALDRPRLQSWMRVVAAARLVEKISADEVTVLHQLIAGG